MATLLYEDNLENFVDKIVETDSNLVTVSHSTFDVNDQGIGYSIDYNCGDERHNQRLFLSYLEHLSDEVEKKFEDIGSLLDNKYNINSEFNGKNYSLKLTF